MKIADLAKKLDFTPKELREKISVFGYEVGKKSRTIKDKIAEEVIDKINKEKEFLEKSEAASIKDIAPRDEKKSPKTNLKTKTVVLPPIVTVKDFSTRLNLPVTEVIKELVKNGVMATINENIDFETAAIIAEDLGYSVKPAEEEKIEVKEKVSAKDLQTRPPVVTIIGHIDHGKTSLLDYIRKTNIVGGESGGITQHIGAYQIEIKKEGKKRLITFLDTPGHEAFVAMREHGTKLCDMAILVVAADEGVMPQTIEAVNHTKAAGVPIIVAINKADKPEADIERVKKQLAKINLTPEEWGGATIMIPVSAKTGKGVSGLLEMILLSTDLEGLKTSYSGTAKGVVIESHLDPQKGSTASILIQKGILKVRDIVVSGDRISKIRSMENFLGQKIREAKPSDPVRVYGFSAVPDFGEEMTAFETEKTAKEYLLELDKRRSYKGMIAQMANTVSSQKPGVQKLNVIIKADVAGSLKAVLDAVKKIKNDQGEVFVIMAGVGAVSESDVMSADASGAAILAFRALTSPAAKELAQEKRIKIASFSIIYELIDEAKKMLAKLIGPIRTRKEIGTAKILAVFKHGKGEKIIGANITEGKLVNGAEVEVFRGEDQVGIGKIDSLKIKQEDVREIEKNNECGIGLEANFEMLVGDKIKAFEIEEKMPEIK